MAQRIFNANNVSILAGGSIQNRVALVDNSTLVNLANIGALENLTKANRTIWITEQIIKEAVDDAFRSGHILSAMTINRWIEDGKRDGTVIATDKYGILSDAESSGPDPGEVSLVRAARELHAEGRDVLILSDDRSFFTDSFRNVDGFAPVRSAMELHNELQVCAAATRHTNL